MHRKNLEFVMASATNVIRVKLGCISNDLIQVKTFLFYSYLSKYFEVSEAVCLNSPDWQVAPVSPPAPASRGNSASATLNCELRWLLTNITGWSTWGQKVTFCCWRQLSCAINTQRKARNVPSWELWVAWAVFLWHKRAGINNILWTSDIIFDFEWSTMKWHTTLS